jgi:hypothetical protein
LCNSASSIRESIGRLKMLTAEAKPVFVLEYRSKEKQAQKAIRARVRCGLRAIAWQKLTQFA